jgi:Asp-tRNA(Asn)/Glu-tRNA(Gln) amidotransferase A subunit family amidase
MENPEPINATELLTRLHGGDINAEDAARLSFDRIAERDHIVGAWAYIDPAATIESVRAMERRSGKGALYGLPIGIKDIIATSDMPTRYNCELFADPQQTPDAACVALLRQAGATILGKTETVELASIGRVARTRNPRAPDHTPGGSSSGSAAAVADGHIPVALGTQTGGSIIRPASFCGVWALKPTWGLVSTEGAKPFAPSLDTIGWFGQSAADLKLMLDVLAPAPTTIEPIDPATLNIAVWRTAGWPRAERATIEAMAATISALERVGAHVTEVTLPTRFDGLAQAQRIVMFAEGQRSFLAEYRRDPGKLHPRIAAMVQDAGGFDATDLRAAYDLAGEARAAFDALAARYDAVLAPSTIAEAPFGLTETGDLLFNGLFTLLHVPCVNIPFHHAANGLPVGITLTGPRFTDAKVIVAAAAVLRACEAAAQTT